jgi:DNA polymerase
VDARERLRHYLEQRRELGESEFVLDGLSLDEAMRALGAKVAPVLKGAGPPAPGADSTSRRAGADVAVDGDWRTVLRAIGAESTPVPEKLGRYEMPSSGTGADAQVAAAHENAKEGIVVGMPMADAATGSLAHLESIEAVARAVASCTLCSLHATAKQAVPGEGNPHAGFVCVGEAPGATEDDTGRPFVGAAGQLLTKILAAIDLAREDVFICNVLKHRPPGNRNPAPDEIAACSPYLLRQLALLQPRVILALGTFAAQTLLRTTTPIGKLRGQVHRYYGVPLIVTYHPAALLRNPNWKRPTWEDVQLARRVFDRAASGA